MEAVPGSAGSMVVGWDVPGVEMSGTVGLGAHRVWICLLCGERGGDDGCAERSLVTGVCYFIQGLAIVAFFFSTKTMCLDFSAARLIYSSFSTNLYAIGRGSRFVDLWGDFRRLKKNNLNPSQALEGEYGSYFERGHHESGVKSVKSSACAMAMHGTTFYRAVWCWC